MLLNWVRERSINSLSYYFSSALESYLPPISYFSSTEKHPLLLDQGINIYSVDDSSSSLFARGLSGCFPGLTVIHHYYLTTRIYEALHNSPWRKNVQFCHEQKITWTSRDTTYAEARHEALREASTSAFTIFTSPRDRECFLSCNEPSLANKTAYIPFPVADRHLRKVNRVSQKIAVISGVNLEWHPHCWLMALPDDTPVSWYIIGDNVDRAKEIARNYSKKISIHECTTPDIWREALEDGPLVIHPLYSGYHSLSPYLEMSLAAGVRIITNDFGYPRYFPNDLFYRVPMGRKEASLYRALFTHLLDGNESESVAEQRFHYAYSVHGAQKVAHEFASALKEMVAQRESILKSWSMLYASAQKEVLRDIVRDPVLESALYELTHNNFQELREDV